MRSFNPAEGGPKSAKTASLVDGFNPSGLSSRAITPGWEQVNKEEVESESVMDSGYIEHPETEVEVMDKAPRRATSAE